MKKNIIALVLTTCLTVFMYQNINAGNRAGAFTITPGAAYDFWANKRYFQNTWLIPTLQLAYNFNDQWAIEAMYGTFGTSQTSSAGAGSLNGNVVTIDGLYRFSNFHQRVEPYLAAGLGVFHINPNGTSATNQANINAGMGAQLFFDNSVALRGEVRDLYTISGGKNDVTIGFGVSYLI
jgi:OOP family OmpA-OmpF porin